MSDIWKDKKVWEEEVEYKESESRGKKVKVVVEKQ